MAFLKTYKIVLTVKSPVFIGAGVSIEKKEYVFDTLRKKVKIPHLHKMFLGLKKMGRLKQYEEYMLDGRDDLIRFFSKAGIAQATYDTWMKYELDAGDAVFEDRSKKEIHLFTKDAMGLPFIPGSSLKGALRTAILNQYFFENEPERSKYEKILNDVDISNQRNKLLGEEAKSIETDAFMKLNRISNKPRDILNDWMAAVKVSDSKPLKLDDLVLCQKLDMNIKGELKPMPILRECLKPGTVVEFTLTLDDSLYEISKEQILFAIKNSYQHQYDVFMKEFKVRMEPYPYSIFIGGGSGYVSKTIVYSILQHPRGVKKVSQIIDGTLGFKAKEQHKHFRDASLGVSPHTLKMTKYLGKLYTMGLCQIDII